MKLTFRGWKREVTFHQHDITPIQSTGSVYKPLGKDQPIQFDGLKGRGKITRLALSGDFLLEVHLSPQDLESALMSFSKSDPEAALRIAVAAQAEATIALIHTSQAASKQ